MNKVVNKFLLAGDKFMPEIHLKQPVFTYSACVPFTKMILIRLVFNTTWLMVNQNI